MSFLLAPVEDRDPRVHLSEKDGPVHHVLDDGLAPNFETFLHFAGEQRAKEVAEAPRLPLSLPRHLMERRGEPDEAALAVTDADYRAAYSSLRAAYYWGSVVYLITTDILGPHSTLWTFAQVEYGPSVACFVVFGIMAAYSCFLLWYMFLKSDSNKYPLSLPLVTLVPVSMAPDSDTLSNIFHALRRIVDDFALSNILQSLQFLFNVGQGLAQMTKFIDDRNHLTS
ncbi:hypothetical protein PAXINDRAFT_8184 [Paxillus involutus ATCC 200175]|nr:hypothetical protein PAXINDRAFT_8184 [Paxillus involutus ATCC 200175]